MTPEQTMTSLSSDEMATEREGIHIPGWAVAAITMVVALISTGVWAGLKAEAQSNQNVTVDYRLCRIERALNIDPWVTCARPTMPSGGQP